MPLKDKVVETELGKEEGDSGFESMVVKISSDNNLVTLGQPCLHLAAQVFIKRQAWVPIITAELEVGLVL